MQNYDDDEDLEILKEDDNSSFFGWASLAIIIILWVFYVYYKFFYKVENTNNFDYLLRNVELRKGCYDKFKKYQSNYKENIDMINTMGKGGYIGSDSGKYDNFIFEK